MAEKSSIVTSSVRWRKDAAAPKNEKWMSSNSAPEGVRDAKYGAHE
jgi:hypothetical protein